MKKKDKLVVLFGVAILIIASIGIYYYKEVPSEKKQIEMEDFYKVTGVLNENIPEAVIVSDTCPFYALIATPLAVHYDSNGKQEIVPLYVENISAPSSAVISTMDLVGRPVNLVVDGSDTPEEVSLGLAKDYWKKSDAVLLIEDSQEGYNLGLVATPIASYLGIPIIVSDGFDERVYSILGDLDVKYYLVCGDLSPYAPSFRFNSVEEVINFTIDLIKNKFGNIDYITLANPLDAWPPEVEDSKVFHFGPETIKSASMNTQTTIGFVVKRFSTGASWEFEIPDDYKYALIELDGYNYEVEGVDTFGDSVGFSVDPVGDGFNVLSVGTSHGIPLRDGKGNIIEDRVHAEAVLYGCGGKRYRVSAHGSWTLKDEGKVSARVTVKKLQHPVYEMMKGLSSIAPYLTAYHKGILFAKPEFAFTADDTVITDKGEKCTGFYLPGRNPKLVPLSNKHIYDNIHRPLNKLLAKLANLPYETTTDLEYLTDYYKNNPVYIALVGGATVLPRYIYQNEVEPIGDIDGDGVDDTVSITFGGGGTNSDNIYGDIDPVEYDWSNQAGDIYSGRYPYLENIVGRITGWDVQDASALIARTVFYNEIIAKLTEWKDKYGNLFGGGVDFRKPLWIQILNHLPGVKQILNLANQLSSGFLNYAEGPWKYDTGFSKIMAEAIENKIGKYLGFEVETALHEAAMIDGFSDEALDQMKKASLWNRLTFSKSQVKELAGEGNVKGREILENSNFLWITGHGCPYNFDVSSPDLVASGFDGIILNAPKLWQKFLKNTIIPHFVVGFWGPGGGLGKVGEYTPRSLSTVDFGPSFVWLESCFCARITGISPQTNVGQTFIHSGVNTLIASTTGSNIPGGYLPGKNHMWDTWLGTKIRYKQWEKKTDEGIYPKFHFGLKIYNDMCYYMKDDGATIGEAFRDAKNRYLPEDADWELWWSPPLTTTQHGGSSEDFGPHLSSKYTSFQEYCLYGDPAFTPYIPKE